MFRGTGFLYQVNDSTAIRSPGTFDQSVDLSDQYEGKYTLCVCVCVWRGCECGGWVDEYVCVCVQRELCVCVLYVEGVCVCVY